VLSGTESEVDSAAEAALGILDKLNKELEEGPKSQRAHDENQYSR
jgi:hypothetical protein